MFLTRLPVGRIPDPVPSISAAQWAYPWVGLIVGTVCWGAFSVSLAFGATQTLSAIISFMAMALVTGGLHQDGLADFADGLGGGRDAEHCLEIMRDSRIGSYGVLALIIAVLAWIHAVSEVGTGASIALFLAVAINSRATMTILLIILPPARSDGLGALASGEGQLRYWSLLLSGALTVALLGNQGLLIILAALLSTAFVGLAAWKRVGGHTGDVLGASQFVSDTVCWAVIVIALTNHP